MKMNLHLVLAGFFGFDLNGREREKEKVVSAELLESEWYL
jgi:hypothetical protein